MDQVASELKKLGFGQSKIIRKAKSYMVRQKATTITGWLRPTLARQWPESSSGRTRRQWTAPPGNPPVPTILAKGQRRACTSSPAPADWPTPPAPPTIPFLCSAKYQKRSPCAFDNFFCTRFLFGDIKFKFFSLKKRNKLKLKLSLMRMSRVSFHSHIVAQNFPVSLKCSPRH